MLILESELSRYSTDYPTTWTTEELVFDFLLRKEIFSSPLCPEPLWGPPTVQRNKHRRFYKRR
jgi:hypothetical protein